MDAKKVWLHFSYSICTLLIFCINPCLAQQPFLKFKPNPIRVDSFDYILSMAPFQLLSSKLGLTVDMRLQNKKTLRISSHYRKEIRQTNIGIQDSRSGLSDFNEQGTTFMLKQYKDSKKSRVYFGPYLGFGLELRRAFVNIETPIPNFETEKEYCSTKRRTVFFVIGATKLFSKNIIFDYYTAIKYQFKPSNTGECTITGLGYKQGVGGLFGFTIGWPIKHNTNIK